MSYHLWVNRYASDPSVIGSVFELNFKPFTVVAIAPPRFYGDSLRTPPPDFFVPLATGDPPPDSASADPSLAWLQLIGASAPADSDSNG